MVRQIPDPEQRARVLTWLLPRLPRDSQQEALIQTIAAVRDLSDQQRIAGGPTGYYGGDIGERYLETGVRAKALAELGEVLATWPGRGRARRSSPNRSSSAAPRATIGFWRGRPRRPDRWRAVRDRRGPAGAADGPVAGRHRSPVSIGDAANAPTLRRLRRPRVDGSRRTPGREVAAVGRHRQHVRLYKSATLSALAPHLPAAVLADALDIARESTTSRRASGP